jgi:hypothetical protein
VRAEARLRGDLQRASLATLGRALGMPEGADVVKYHLDPVPPGWAGYTIETVGCVVPKPKHPPRWAWDRRPEDGEGQVIQLWRQRVQYGDSDVYLETRWHPETGVTQDLRPLDSIETDDDLHAAGRLLERLFRARGFVPKGRRKLDPIKVRDDLYAALRRYQAEHDGAYPSNLAEELCGLVIPPKSRDTVLDWLKVLRREHIPFPPRD